MSLLWAGWHRSCSTLNSGSAKRKWNCDETISNQDRNRVETHFTVYLGTCYMETCKLNNIRDFLCIVSMWQEEEISCQLFNLWGQRDSFNLHFVIMSPFYKVYETIFRISVHTLMCMYNTKFKCFKMGFTQVEEICTQTKVQMIKSQFSLFNTLQKMC